MHLSARTAPLARDEATIAVPLLFERLPGLRLKEDGMLRWQTGLLN
jgi:hypothetical protein